MEVSEYKNVTTRIIGSLHSLNPAFAKKPGICYCIRSDTSP